jgi:mono/diheme cytochrome c family protein
VSFYCLRDYAAAGGEFSPRANNHAVLAVVLFLVLVIKILVIRVYKQWKGLLLGYGQSAFILAMLMILSSAGWYLLVSQVGKGESAPPYAPSRRTSAPETQAELAARAGDVSKGKALYQQYCTPCHGVSGRGDGPAAASLPVKPRNHTDGAYMNALSDDRLAKAITQGGASVGKSSIMPAWGSTLSEKDVQDVIAYLRTLAVPPYKPQ